MDKNLEIRLGSTKNANSITLDTYDKISLDNQQNKILEYDIRNILSVTEVFEKERQSTQIYRIYGGMEYFSLLNGIKRNYELFEDFFIRDIDLREENTGQFKDIFSSFAFFLVRPTTGYTRIINHRTEYIRQFEVVATPNEFELYNAGYSKNVFNEQKYGFAFNTEFDVTTLLDDFGFPLTDLYLYPAYVTEDNGEILYRTNWHHRYGTLTIIEMPTDELPENIQLGDMVYGDKIEYSKTAFLQVEDEPQTYYITTPYENDTGGDERLRWKYNPFIPLKLRYFGNDIKRANTGSTAYDQTLNIPYYATPVDSDGNVVWREILQQGYIDPLSGDGVDYPFVNKRRYLFSDIKLTIIPDLSDSHTADMFTNLNFGAPTSLYNEVSGDLDNIGKPCQ